MISRSERAREDPNELGLQPGPCCPYFETANLADKKIFEFTHDYRQIGSSSSRSDIMMVAVGFNPRSGCPPNFHSSRSDD